jgi:hypothetical protein
MSESPFVLRIHVIGGQTIELPCTTFEIVPPGIEHDDAGNPVETPIRLEYSPVDGWRDTLGFIEFRAITAIEVHRSAEMVAQAEDE